MMSDYVLLLIAEGLYKMKTGDIAPPKPTPWEVGRAAPLPPPPAVEQRSPPMFPPANVPTKKRSRQITLQGILDQKEEEDQEDEGEGNKASTAEPAATMPAEPDSGSGCCRVPPMAKKQKVEGQYVITRNPGSSVLKFTRVH